MKKNCNSCNYRNSGSALNCVMCNAPLPPGGSLAPDARCCPSPSCIELAVAPPALYCPLCGEKLEPVSNELWEEKFVEPALEKNFVATLQEPSQLLRLGGEMGLLSDEAEKQLDRALERRAGVPPDILRQWVREEVVPLGRTRAGTSEAHSEVLAHAENLNINPFYADLLLRTLAAEPASPPEPQTSQTFMPPPSESAPAATGTLPIPAGTGEPTHTETTIPAAVATATTINAPSSSGEAALDDGDPPHTEAYRDADADWMAASTAKEEAGDNVFMLPKTKRSLTRRVVLGVVLACVLSFLGIALFVPSVLSPPQSDDTIQLSTRHETGITSTTEPDPLPDVPPSPALSPSPASTPSPEEILDSNSNNSNTDSSVEQAAFLTLYTNAQGVQVWINGRQGVVSRGAPANFKLPPGTQNVTASLSGHKQYQRRLSLVAGEKRALFLPLIPLGATPQPREDARQHLQAAQILFQGRNLQAALDEVNEGLRIAPGNRALLRLKRNIETARTAEYRLRSTPIQQPSPPPPRAEYREPRATPQPTPYPQPVESVVRYEAPRMNRKYTPIYPTVARTMRVSGVVLVNVSLDEGGRIIDARAIDGPKLLQQTAVDAAMRSTYSPGRRNGQPVRSSLTVNFVFKLQ